MQCRVDFMGRPFIHNKHSKTLQSNLREMVDLLGLEELTNNLHSSHSFMAFIYAFIVYIHNIHSFIHRIHSFITFIHAFIHNLHS